MKTACKCALQTFLMERLSKVRFENHLTQAQFAEILLIDPRSYAAIENGEHGCCALTLMMFLLFCCKDPNGFINDFKPKIIEILERGESIDNYSIKNQA